MYTNTDITLYHWNGSSYNRRPIYNVFWDSVKSSNVLKSGQVNADSVKIFVPVTSVGSLSVETSKDLVVVGIIDFEFDNTSQATQSNSLKALKADRAVFTVSSCDGKLYGSPHMQHYLLSCK